MRARVWLPVVALFAASVWCVVLVVARRHAYGPGGFRYLVWNLGLAWLPLVFALLLYVAFRRRHTIAELLALGAAWLVFLPNAPYMLTDFIHLGDRHRLVDSLILASFAFTALALGFASLLLVQIVVTRKAGAPVGWLVALGALFLASVGVYLGRVHRFNSWDVVDAAAARRVDDVAGPRQPVRARRTSSSSSLPAAGSWRSRTSVSTGSPTSSRRWARRIGARCYCRIDSGEAGRRARIRRNPVRRGLRRRHAADRRALHLRDGAVGQRPRDVPGLPGRDPRARGLAPGRVGLPAPLRRPRHPHAGRPAGRARRDEPGGAEDQPPATCRRARR